ncbi:hypothetical protein [Sorangium sp. So ce1151]|uniref:hypothetical protein n=1 Tax=Sorangium sp. So ce1151 TaxID=3133332 RepID=UPI003F61C4C9
MSDNASIPAAPTEASHLNPADWLVATWQQGGWSETRPDELNVAPALVARNTGKRPKDLLLCYRAALLDGDFRVAGEIRGPVNVIGMNPVDGQDHVIHCAMPRDSDWHSFVLERSGGRVTATLDGKPLAVSYTAADATLKGYFAVALGNGQQCALRQFAVNAGAAPPPEPELKEDPEERQNIKLRIA